ncbi:hypothetical protein CC78DRAFT_564012 [Lojkania enalia]|uniref:Nineteen complex-related protein 2-domain-containing protein n=1 Tax=Lojkania enalia TaxID=147567 RepID=A0A9P4NCF6_9PLEO|nr:hypothetical protein CC78DRAFT_564012 [Didymosphaeria enalia]
MKRSGSGRVPRKIGGDGEGEGGDESRSQPDISKAPPEPVVKRPLFSKAKKRSSLRISFGPSDADGNGSEESSDSTVVTPKKSNLSRIAIEKNAERRARPPLVSELSNPRAGLDENRPSYSKDYIAELRNSTPSTPKDLDKVPTDDDSDSCAIDIASKFGPLATLSAEEPSAIPTEAEIREKKARRARAAREHAASELHNGDEEEDNWDSNEEDEFRTNRNEVSLRAKDKYAETRLVRDDEDIAEGFDEYVEDGSISIGRKAEREAERKRRAEMAQLIAEAEGGSEEDESDSEVERNAAYEEAQTRAGAYGTKVQQTDNGARTPPKITPLPDLTDIIMKMEADLASKKQRKQSILRELEEVKEEKVHIAERQKYIQEQLEKTGQQYEKLRQEAGMAAIPMNATDGPTLIVERGLESLGTTPIPARDEEAGDE